MKTPELAELTALEMETISAGWIPEEGPRPSLGRRLILALRRLIGDPGI